MGMTIKNTDFLTLRSLKVIDKDGNKIGRIKDALIDRRNLKVKGYVVYGSKFEEAMEDLRLIDNIDPVITPENVIQLSEKAIFLNRTKTELTNIAVLGVKGEEDVLFSELVNYPVTDSLKKSLGVLTNFYVNGDSSISYQLGGKDFIKYLQEKYMTENLSYLIYPDNLQFNSGKFNNDEIKWVHGHYEIQQKLTDIERDLKLNMTNVIRDLLLEALKDGKLSEDEKGLINAVTVDLATYNTALELAYEDGIITEEEEELLDGIKEKILKKIHKISKIDNMVSEDERALIMKFASFMVNRRKELFWKVFGTVSKKNN